MKKKKDDVYTREIKKFFGYPVEPEKEDYSIVWGVFIFWLYIFVCLLIAHKNIKI